MNIRKIITIILIILIFLSTGRIYTFAMDTGFKTDNMESEEQQTFLKNVDLNLITEQPPSYSVLCFDVNEDGLIALGSKALDKKIVSIYSSDGVFMYGYTFNCSGSYGIEWDENNLIIYFVRSDVAAMFDEKGSCLELKMIPITAENNSYWNYFVFSKKRIVGESGYRLKNDMGPFLNVFASSYSQLIKTDSDGSTTVIYDVSDSQLLYSIIWIAAIVLIIAIAITAIAKQWKKNIKESNKNDELINSIMKNAFDNNNQK